MVLPITAGTSALAQPKGEMVMIETITFTVVVLALALPGFATLLMSFATGAH
jgi:hypothetical protein